MILPGISAFAIFIIVLELYTGCALMGWAGDNMVVEREKAAGPYWFAVIFHVLAGVVLPLVIYFAL